MSQLSKAIGHWWPWLSHFLLSVHFPLSRFQNRQGDLVVLTDAAISCFRHAGFHLSVHLAVWKALTKGKENKQHPLLDNLLIVLQRLAGCPCKRYISFQKKKRKKKRGTMLFIESLESDVELGSKTAACLHFPPSLHNGNTRRISENETRTLQSTSREVDLHCNAQWKTKQTAN